jgi:plasmid stabilization system protein ParE
MRLDLHPKVYSDVSQIMEYYERVATPELADEFYRELRYFIGKAVEAPQAFAIREHDVRRVNLRRFPYHFLFRLTATSVRILAIRHHGRHPSVGTGRR